MANEDDVIEGDAGEAETVDDKDKARSQQSKAMNSMTDLVPEKTMDEGKVKKAMADLEASQRASKEAQLAYEKELAAVKINKEDVDVIAIEFEMDKKMAERKLREHGRRLQDALKALL